MLTIAVDVILYGCVLCSKALVYHFAIMRHAAHPPPSLSPLLPYFLVAFLIVRSCTSFEHYVSCEFLVNISVVFFHVLSLRLRSGAVPLPSFTPVPSIVPVSYVTQK